MELTESYVAVKYTLQHELTFLMHSSLLSLLQPAEVANVSPKASALSISLAFG